MSGFALYRYTHADGGAKEWAWRPQPQAIEVRWGPAGRLVHQAFYPLARRPEIEERARAKVRKGYRYVGGFSIDESGRPAPLTAPAKGARAPTAKPPAQAAPPIDLSQVQTGGEDYWF